MGLATVRTDNVHEFVPLIFILINLDGSLLIFQLSLVAAKDSSLVQEVLAPSDPDLRGWLGLISCLARVVERDRIHKLRS